jgi:hypothetical protein
LHAQHAQPSGQDPAHQCAQFQHHPCAVPSAKAGFRLHYPFASKFDPSVKALKDWLKSGASAES